MTTSPTTRAQQPLLACARLGCCLGKASCLRGSTADWPGRCCSYVGTGNGTVPSEVYTPYHPNSLTDYTPIDPYEETILRNEATGLWCQLRPLLSNATQIGEPGLARHVAVGRCCCES